MTDKLMNGNLKSRYLLAPHPWPEKPVIQESAGVDKSAPVFYLSWPGWELYLSRRLAWAPASDGPQPLLLPDLVSPEHDFAVIDQLVKAAGESGAGLITLNRDRPNGWVSLAEAIAHYVPAADTPRAGPILDDRSYLALWAVSEFQASRSNALLAEAAIGERAMWAALKGEESVPEPVLPDNNQFPAAEPDPRAVYAWRCWRRLAAPLIKPGDVILPTAPLDE